MKCLVLCCLMVRTFKNIDGDVDDVFLTVSVFHALVSNVIIAVCFFFFVFHRSFVEMVFCEPINIFLLCGPSKRISCFSLLHLDLSCK